MRNWNSSGRWTLIRSTLEPDNNLIENKIRPLALGRKNYLFAGSHEAAQRIAMMYTFLGTCAANEVNPYGCSSQPWSGFRRRNCRNFIPLSPGISSRSDALQW